jgi:hypothetical protein
LIEPAAGAVVASLLNTTSTDLLAYSGNGSFSVAALLAVAILLA